MLLQHRAQAHPGVGEELHVDHSPAAAVATATVGGVGTLAVVDEGEVRVLAPVAPPGDLTANPHTIGEPAPQRVVDGIAEFGDRIGRVGSVVEFVVAEVERRLAHGADSISRQRLSGRCRG